MIYQYLTNLCKKKQQQQKLFFHPCKVKKNQKQNYHKISSTHENVTSEKYQNEYVPYFFSSLKKHDNVSHAMSIICP